MSSNAQKTTTTVDPALFEQFNCKPLNAAAAPDASVPITPGETEEAPKNRRLPRFNEL